ncbi:MAG: hypothetical protein E6R12_10720 [Sphingomonadales bacterium]|nr:MAG: hypothetical protein E6R12_10720 [Sphingomonadales bacterium]
MSKINNLDKHLETLLAGVYGVLNTVVSQVADFAVGGSVAPIVAVEMNGDMFPQLRSSKPSYRQRSQ